MRKKQNKKCNNSHRPAAFAIENQDIKDPTENFDND